MLDLAFIRSHPEVVKEAARLKNNPIDIDALLTIDQQALALRQIQIAAGLVVAECAHMYDDGADLVAVDRGHQAAAHADPCDRLEAAKQRVDEIAKFEILNWNFTPIGADARAGAEACHRIVGRKHLAAGAEIAG